MPLAVAKEIYNLHFQSTVVPQWHGTFTSPYIGQRSLLPTDESYTTLSATFYAGLFLGPETTIYISPETTGGRSLSDCNGLGGFSNGEAFKVGDPTMKVDLSRIFLRQTFNFGEINTQLDEDLLQLPQNVSDIRSVVTIGKFGLTDYFDLNKYSHDPRTQFFNWAFMDKGAWDYAADTWGYTWGIMFEYYNSFWAIRGATCLIPKEANGMIFDTNITKAQGNNIELELHYLLHQQPGAIRFLGWLNNANMGLYQEAIDKGVSIEKTRSYRSKYGWGINIEQAITSEIGLFSRFGWSDGLEEAWIFTEIDNTFTFGVSIMGNLWQRPEDTFGIGFASNGLSNVHAQYLADGGIGMILGDGNLRYGREQILEMYYSYYCQNGFYVSGDVQWIQNPGYNQDRGPTTIYAVRFHYEI